MQTAEAPAPAMKGGRPRKYASEEDLEALKRIVDGLSGSAPVVTETVAAQRPVTDDDKAFIQSAIIAYVTAEGASVVGDMSLPGTVAVISSLLAVRDYICENAGALKAKRSAQLREKGVI